MASTGWKTFTLPEISPPILVAPNLLTSVAEIAVTSLKTLKASISVISATAIPSLDASKIAIKAAVTAIETAVKSLTEDTGVYVLLVPPRSKVIIPAAVKTALASKFSAVPTPEGLNIQAMFEGEQQTPLEINILHSLFSATGGNAGFVRAVVESFDDLGDDNRPILSDTDAVAGVYIVAGAKNIASLFAFTNGMTAILSPGSPTTLDPPATPTAQDLTAKASIGSTIRLRWAFQKQLVAIPVLDTVAKITEVAIIRSTSVSLLSASTPQELFGTNKLTAGMSLGDGTEVITVYPYKELDYQNTYLDDADHAPGAKYYYAVSFRVMLGTAHDVLSGSGHDIGFARLSNVVKVYIPKDGYVTPRSIAGIPPDWIRTPRTIDVIPEIGGLLNQVAALSVEFGDTSTGYAELLKTNIKVLEQQIKAYEALSADLSATVAKISAFGSVNLGAVSSRAFAGVGGTNFVKKDIVKAFGDVADPNRPPFDEDEFVSGVVILATTPDAVGALNVLLGAIASSVSSLGAALATIDVELSAIETAVFNDDLTTSSAAASASSELTGVPQIGTGSYCYQTYASSETFNDDLSPRSP